jgi:hypothetical protein
MSNLTQAWTIASAALPLGWEILAVLRSEGVLDTEDRDSLGREILDSGDVRLLESDWWAIAAGPQEGPAASRWDGRLHAFGAGATPQQALLDLAARLQPLRGNPNG